MCKFKIVHKVFVSQFCVYDKQDLGHSSMTVSQSQQSTNDLHQINYQSMQQILDYSKNDNCHFVSGKIDRIALYQIFFTHSSRIHTHT